MNINIIYSSIDLFIYTAGMPIVYRKDAIPEKRLPGGVVPTGKKVRVVKNGKVLKKTFFLVKSEKTIKFVFESPNKYAVYDFLHKLVIADKDRTYFRSRDGDLLRIREDGEFCGSYYIACRDPTKPYVVCTTRKIDPYSNYPLEPVME